MEALDYRGKTAAITGAAGGLGKGLARCAVDRGMNVVIADKAADLLRETAAELDALGGSVLAVPTDVTDPEAVERFAQQATDRFGPVHLLVNNAGIETLGFSWEIPAHVWALAVNVNLLGVVYCANAFVRRMIEAGQPAQIANVSSIGGVATMALTAPYTVTKHAVVAYTESLKLDFDLKQAPIDVSLIMPGSMATRIFTDAPAVEGDPYVVAHRQIMHEMLQKGLTPQQAAETIFEQLARRQFWITTDRPVLESMIKERGRYLAALETPVLHEQLRSLFGH